MSIDYCDFFFSISNLHVHSVGLEVKTKPSTMLLCEQAEGNRGVSHLS